jgi:hypothetical protein
MKVRHLLAVAVLLLATGRAYACLFATSTPPEGWYQWSSMLYAGDVAAVETNVVTVRVVETFKGPQAAGTGTLTVSLSSRYWTNCKVDKPAVGARVLVAMNANSDAMLVPLTASFADKLRAYKAR